MVDSEIPIIDYYSADPDAASSEGRAGCAVASLACGAVPVIGLVLQSAVIGMLGATIIAWIGFGLGLRALVARGSEPGIRVLAGLGMAWNGFVAGLVFWAFFVHGIC